MRIVVSPACYNGEYEDTKDEQYEKDTSLVVKNYWDGLKKDSLKYLRETNIYYHRDGLKYVVEAILKSCEAWGRSERRNLDMGHLFRSLRILEKQQFLPESTLKLYWKSEGLDEMQVREVAKKFADLNFVKRERVSSCIVKGNKVCVRLHDLVHELCDRMKVYEQQAWHIGLINGYRSVSEDDTVMGIGSGEW